MDSEDAVHLFSGRPIQEKLAQAIENYSWFHQGKIVNVHNQPPFTDLEIGFCSPFGSLARGMSEHQRLSIEQRNSRYSTVCPQNHRLLTSKLGPPLLNASEKHGIVTWEMHRFAALDRARDGREAEGGQERTSRLERFLSAPTIPLPCYSSRFRSYNDEMWNVRHGGGRNSRQGSCPPFPHISRHLESLQEITRRSPDDDHLDEDFEIIQSRRRGWEANLSREQKILRGRVAQK